MGCMASVKVLPNPGGNNVFITSKRGSRHSIQSAYSASGMIIRRNIKLPLTERDVFSVTKSWKAISRNMTNTGIHMFLKMFETRSDVKAMFEQFRTVEKADLGSSRALENHALLVMNALDESISNLDDPEYLIDMLLTTGKSHRRFEDFAEMIFWAIEKPFLDAIKETMGDRFTPTLEKLYSTTIHFVLQVLIMGFKSDVQGGESTSQNVMM